MTIHSSTMPATAASFKRIGPRHCMTSTNWVLFNTHLAVRIFPSTPLVPKPPGSTTPSTPSRVSHASACFSVDSSLDSSCQTQDARFETGRLRRGDYFFLCRDPQGDRQADRGTDREID